MCIARTEHIWVAFLRIGCANGMVEQVDKIMIKAFLGFAIALSSGCVQSDSWAENTSHQHDAGIDTESLGHPKMNGQVRQQASCSNEEYAKIISAIGVARDLVSGGLRSSMLSCLLEASISFDRRMWPELLIEKLSEDMPTSIYCDDLDPGKNAETEHIGVDFEELTLDQSAIENSSPAQLAAIILHEITHNKGYTHTRISSELASAYSYPYVVQMCALAVHGTPLDLGRGPVPAIYSNSRSRYRQSEYGLLLSGVGSGVQGANEFSATCDGRAFASGINVCRFPSQLSCLGLRCTGLNGSDVPDTVLDVTAFGLYRSMDCGDGSYMVGIHGFAGGGINGLAPVCATRSDLIFGHKPVSRPVSLEGYNVGLKFERLCPAGMAVKSVNGIKSFAGVGRIELVCQEWNQVWTSEVIETETIDLSGGDVDMVIEKRCTTGAFTELYSAGSISVLQAGCTPMLRDDLGLPMDYNTDILPVSTPSDYLLTSAVWGDASRCLRNEFVVGFRYHRTVSGDGWYMQPACAESPSWQLGDRRSLHFLPWVGYNGPVEPHGTMLCDRTLVVGWRLGYGPGGVKSISLLCGYPASANHSLAEGSFVAILSAIL